MSPGPTTGPTRVDRRDRRDPRKFEPTDHARRHEHGWYEFNYLQYWQMEALFALHSVQQLSVLGEVALGRNEGGQFSYPTVH